MNICESLKDNKCSECDNRKIIIAKENKCSFRLINHKLFEICKLKIDNCYFQTGRKCDFAIFICKLKIVFLVELKGSDFMKAITQIDETINKMKNKLIDFTIKGRIVLTKVNVPDIRNDPKVYKLEKKLRNSKGDLKYGTIMLIENI
jgi:hypothetical protein